MAHKWDSKYADAPDSGIAAAILTENQHLLPASGRVLDLACGLGANALLLASRGLETHAWDTSQVAIERLQTFAKQRKLRVNAVVRDVVKNPPVAADCWDVVVVSHFLDRALCRQISDSLSPGGLLFYQTFTEARVSENGPSNPDFLLQENELLGLFSDLMVRFYREEGIQGDPQRGHRNKAYLIGQKPPVSNDGGITD
ncbi:MAG: methyltransferase domain-containing protein [Gammaproteobacteria bacterium]|nr:methyltransferase domain-containing protein [Gammaproteobacteria bacterium]